MQFVQAAIQSCCMHEKILVFSLKSLIVHGAIIQEMRW